VNVTSVTPLFHPSFGSNVTIEIILQKESNAKIVKNVFTLRVHTHHNTPKEKALNLL
jgi:hypothetical protein